jgi:hypothetical protein
MDCDIGTPYEKSELLMLATWNKDGSLIHSHPNNFKDLMAN